MVKIKGIYCIKNIVNSKLYIGMSKNIFNRQSKHISLLKQNTHHNKHLQAAFNKYGIENFKFDVIFSSNTISLERLEEIEREFIYTAKQFKKLYNKTIGRGYLVDRKEVGKNISIGLVNSEKRKALSIRRQIKVKLLDIQSGEVINFDSIKSASKSIGVDPGDFSRLLANKSRGTSISGRYKAWKR